MAVLGAVDCVSHPDACSKANIKAYPTLVLQRGPDLSKIWNGDRTKPALVAAVSEFHALQQAPAAIQSHAGAAAEPPDEDRGAVEENFQEEDTDSADEDTPVAEGYQDEN